MLAPNKLTNPTPDIYISGSELDSLDTWLVTTFGGHDSENQPEIERTKSIVEKLSIAPEGTPVLIHAEGSLTVGFTTENPFSQHSVVMRRFSKEGKDNVMHGASFGVELTDVLHIPYDKEMPYSLVQRIVKIACDGSGVLDDLYVSAGSYEDTERHKPIFSDGSLEVQFAGIVDSTSDYFLQSEVCVGQDEIIVAQCLDFDQDRNHVFRHVNITTR